MFYFYINKFKNILSYFNFINYYLLLFIYYFYHLYNFQFKNYKILNKIFIMISKQIIYLILINDKNEINK